MSHGMMVDQISAYPHEANFPWCDGMVDLIELVVIRLPGLYKCTPLRITLLRNTHLRNILLRNILLRNTPLINTLSRNIPWRNTLLRNKPLRNTQYTFGKYIRNR